MTLTAEQRETAETAAALCFQVMGDCDYRWAKALMRLTGAIVVLHCAHPPDVRAQVELLVRELLVHLYKAPPFREPSDAALKAALERAK